MNDPKQSAPPAGHQTMAQLLQQGLFHHRRGEVALAMERYSEVLQKDPKNAEALYYVAVIACQEGQFKQGVELVRKALGLVPAEARMLNLLGQALDRLGQPLEAVKALDQAIALDPKLAAAHANRANIMVDAGLPDEALKSFDKALALEPNSPFELINRGGLLEMLGRLDDALKDYELAIKLEPNTAEVHANLGSILKYLGQVDAAAGRDGAARFDAAIAAYDRAVKLKPRLHEAYAARGEIKLMRGDWTAGFSDYEHRAEFANPAVRPLPDPRWHGEARPGERIVLVAEPGLSDIIQFCRFAPMLAAQGHDVTVLVRPELAPLLASLKGVAIVTDAAALESKRPLRWMPLTSAPGILKTTPENLPREAYLGAEPARVTALAERLGAAKFKIGVTWSPGEPDRTALSNRHIPLTAFAPLAALPGVELVALQKGPALGDIRGVAFRDKVRSIDPDPNVGPNYFTDTAAAMMGLDLIVGCDSPIVHLAGALGLPVFTMLPVISDWRWMVGRDDSPWYPTMRIFRQAAAGPWTPVMERIVAAVREKLG